MERAVDAGAHVYVEKPFALSVAEARNMLAFAAARRRLVCAGHDRLFDPAWLECRQRIAQGAIGELIHMEVFQAYDLDGPFGRVVAEDDRHWVRRLRGGLFQNVIPHGLSAIADLIQDERPLVSATSWHWDRNQFTRLLVLVRGSQTSATLTFLSSLRPATTYVRVYGRRGWLEVDYGARAARLRVDSTLPSLFTKFHEPWHDMLGGLRGLTRNLIGLLRSDLDYFSGLRRLVRTFYTSVLAGHCSPTDASDIERVAMLLDDVLDALDDSRVLVNPLPASSI
jgi:predicted dehydrogenase